MNSRPTSTRSATLAVCSAALAMAAHGLAGGGAPDTALAVLLTMIVAWGGTAVADRGRGLFAVLVALGTSQLAMHLVLNFAVPSHIGHHAAPVSVQAMLLTHVLATVLTGLLLAKADVAVRVVTSAVRLLTELLKPPTFPAVPDTYALAESPKRGGHLLQVVFCQVCPRRGPPLCS